MKIALVYKNFAASKNISHIGLGVAAINTSKVLRREGYESHVWPITNAADLRNKLWCHRDDIDHVIISAPWIPSKELNELSLEFPNTHFTVNCHSNVGFLQADTNGVKLLREVIELELGTHNIHLAGNCERFCEWVRAAFGAPCAYIPNLYYIDEHSKGRQKAYNGGTIRIGLFGAQRPLKNFMSATAAAIEIGNELGANVEIFMSSGRAEGGGDTVVNAIKQMVHNLPHVTLKQTGWLSWPQFRKVVANMHLLLQPSYSESYNMVTADGIAEGVPSVVSPAIDWVPDYWKAEPDDVMTIAQIGRRQLFDLNAAHDGLKALKHYIKHGLHAYKHFFEECPRHGSDR